MPNWCENQLTIVGDRTERNNFVSAVKSERENKEGEYEILENLYPCPSDLHIISGSLSKDNPEYDAWVLAKNRNIAQYGVPDWYDWCNRYWGTKWGDCETYLVLDDDSATTFEFQSAWSPPIAGLERISEMFPTLEFILTYRESGMGFYGICTFSEGVSIDRCENMEDIEGLSEIDYDDDDAWEKHGELVNDAVDKLFQEVIS